MVESHILIEQNQANNDDKDPELFFRLMIQRVSFQFVFFRSLIGVSCLFGVYIDDRNV